jgi:hypothetical protein
MNKGLKILLFSVIISTFLVIISVTLFSHKNSEKTSNNKTIANKIINFIKTAPQNILNTINHKTQENNNYVIGIDGSKISSGLIEDADKIHVLFIAKPIKAENIQDEIIITAEYSDKSGNSHSQKFILASKTKTPTITIGLQNDNTLLGNYTFSSKNLKFNETENFLKKILGKIVVFHLLEKPEPNQKYLISENKQIMNYATSKINCATELIAKYTNAEDNQTCEPFIYFLRIPSYN